MKPNSKLVWFFPFDQITNKGLGNFISWIFLLLWIFLLCFCALLIGLAALTQKFCIDLFRFIAMFCSFDPITAIMLSHTFLNTQKAISYVFFLKWPLHNSHEMECDFWHSFCFKEHLFATKIKHSGLLVSQCADSCASRRGLAVARPQNDLVDKSWRQAAYTILSSSALRFFNTE